MNRLGMLVDVSHVSEETMADVLAVSKAPVFASHSSCRALSNIPRNMTDEQIKAVAAKGGVVMVNFSSLFLDQKSVDAYLAARAALKPQIDAVREKYKDDPKTSDAEVRKIMKTIHYPDADWTKVVDHIERVMKLGGPKSVGLGSDFDGIDDPPAGLEDVSKLPKLTEELLRRGHSEEVVRGVLGENFLRLLGPGRQGPERRCRRGRSPCPSRSRNRVAERGRSGNAWIRRKRTGASPARSWWASALSSGWRSPASSSDGGPSGCGRRSGR